MLRQHYRRDTSSARNIISGNLEGVDISGSGATGNVVRGNYIGLDPFGTFAIANDTGIAIFANSNTVGGSAAGTGNVISGDATGVYLGGDSNVIMGDLIGPDSAGTTYVYGGLNGIDIWETTTRLVGFWPEKATPSGHM